MTECARCGDCCERIRLSFDPQKKAVELLDIPDLEPHNRHNAEFMRDHWRTIDVNTDEDAITTFIAQCDAFDATTRLCTAHDARPPVCSAYPWYGRPPEDNEGRASVAAALSPRCSFNADVPGRTMLPIVDVVAY